MNQRNRNHGLFSDENFILLKGYPFPMTKNEPNLTESPLTNPAHNLPSILDMDPVENSDILDPDKPFCSGGDKNMFSFSESSSSSCLSGSSNLSSPAFSPPVYGITTRRLSAFLLDQKIPSSHSPSPSPSTSPICSSSSSSSSSKSAQPKRVDSKANKKILRKLTASKPIFPSSLKLENLLKLKESTPTENELGFNPEVSEEKREKNRLAAAKYRQRGRETVVTLERQLTTLIHENCNIKSRNLRMEEELVYLREIVSKRELSQ